MLLDRALDRVERDDIVVVGDGQRARALGGDVLDALERVDRLLDGRRILVGQIGQRDRVGSVHECRHTRAAARSWALLPGARACHTARMEATPIVGLMFVILVAAVVYDYVRLKSSHWAK
jgi:hypothetical protein